jgi:hypothetical protein
MTDAIAAAKAAVEAAHAEQTRLDREESRELGEVRERYREPKIAVARAYAEARRALAEAQSAAAPDHELEGKTVYRIERESHRFGSRFTDKLVAGVVFTYRPGVDLGPGHTYNKPMVGDPMVRLLKKDGKPGAKCERFLGSSAFNSGKARWTTDKDAAVYGATY